MDTIVFFGSARLKSRKEAIAGLNKFKNANPKTITNFAQELRKAQHHVEMSKYYEDAVELSRRLTEWSLNLETNANRFICLLYTSPSPRDRTRSRMLSSA